MTPPTPGTVADSLRSTVMLEATAEVVVMVTGVGREEETLAPGAGEERGRMWGREEPSWEAGPCVGGVWDTLSLFEVLPS